MMKYLVTLRDGGENITHFEHLGDGIYECTHGGWRAELQENQDGSCKMLVGISWVKDPEYTAYEFTDCKSYGEYKERYQDEQS